MHNNNAYVHYTEEQKRPKQLIVQKITYAVPTLHACATAATGPATDLVFEHCETALTYVPARCRLRCDYGYFEVTIYRLKP
jgi:hypothetical protein